MTILLSSRSSNQVLRIADVQEMMAHTDPAMTERYQSGHKTKWTEIEIELKDDALKRDF